MKSVCTLAIRWLKLVGWAPSCVNRLRTTFMGWQRPWRGMSDRVHINLTGLLPNARETWAASWGASLNRCRPNEPPPSTTWQVTASSGRLRLAAMRCLAQIGVFMAAQISQLSGFATATAQLGSSGSPGRKWKMNSSSRTVWPGTAGASGSWAARRSAVTDSTVLPTADPSAQRTLHARTASMHWPKVSPRMAMPPRIWPLSAVLVFGISWTSRMPGIRSTSLLLSSSSALPLMVGGRQRTVGLASGTSRSIANGLVPVTAARASVRTTSVPISFRAPWRLTFTSREARRVRETAAAEASSP